jgi:hypothetical protein
MRPIKQTAFEEVVDEVPGRLAVERAADHRVNARIAGDGDQRALDLITQRAYRRGGGASTERRHATPRHATPRHATPRHG